MYWMDYLKVEASVLINRVLISSCTGAFNVQSYKLGAGEHCPGQKEEPLGHDVVLSTD